MANYVNPWEDTESFIDLGEYQAKGQIFDLYVVTDILGVSCGARFSDNGPDYLGFPLYVAESGKLASDHPLVEAARRYREQEATA